MALASQGVGGGPPVAPDRSLEPIPRPGCGLQRQVSADGPRVSRVLMPALGLVSTAVSCPPISCPPFSSASYGAAHLPRATALRPPPAAHLTPWKPRTSPHEGSGTRRSRGRAGRREVAAFSLFR